METASILGLSLGIPVNIMSIIIIFIGLIMFITEVVPIPVTGLILSLLMGITGCMPLENIYSGFASSAFIMLLGLLVVGDSMFATGLANVLGAKLLKVKALQNEKILFAVLFIISGCCSAFFSNSATIAMLIPICASIVASSNGKLQNKYYIMGIGFAGVIGGTLTLVGSVPQVMANGIIMDAGFESLGMFDFAKVSGISFIVALIYFMTIGFAMEKKVFNFEDVSPVSEEYRKGKEDSQEEEPKLTREMIICACVFLFCAFCFVTGLFPIAVTALIGAAVLFATKAMDFKTTMRNLDWNALMVVATSTSFAAGLNLSGGGKLIADTVLGIFGDNASPAVLMIAGVVISAFLGQLMSMTAIVSMMVPIYLAIAQALGVSPYPFVYALVLAASSGLATPVGNAGITQTMVGGYRFMDYVKIGGPLTIILVIIDCIFCPIMFPF